MQIPEIKSQLTLSELIKHYNLNPDKQNRIHCPFHEDKTPSMQLYWKTNTAYCFSSNCKTHGKSIDVIDFVMYMESFDKLTPHAAKREAIQKTITIINGNMPQTSITAPPTKTAILTKMFSYFKNAVHNSKPAQEYIKSRGLSPFGGIEVSFEVGYNSAQFHHAGRTKATGSPESVRDEGLIKSCLQVGLLYESGTNNKGVRQYGTFGKYCIVFPLKNKEQNITGLYFRSTINDKDQRHFYLKDREGLYPQYPEANTKKLILTESIIDAATLLQQDEITAQYNIIALYGTNGLTEEHIQAIKEWHNSFPFGEGRDGAEIIFFLNGDEPGRTAVKKHSETLQKLLPTLAQSAVEVPEGEDVNSLAQRHSPEIFTELINKRNFLFSIEKENAVYSEIFPTSEEGSKEEKQEQREIEPPIEKKSSETHNQINPSKNHQMNSSANPQILPSVNPQIPPSANQLIPPSANFQINSSSNPLITTNPYKISYKTETANYYIQGGISKIMDSMKITLVIEHLQTQQKSRNKVDLYEDKQVEKLCKEASEKLNLRKDLLETDIYKLTDLLDQKREEDLQKSSEQETESDDSRLLSAKEKNEAETFLKRKHLIQSLNELLGKTGITGEENNRIFLLMIAISYKMPETLHAIIQGSSGSGKTRLMRLTSDCIPKDRVKRFTRMSDKGFYNFPENYFKNTLVCIEDLDGLNEEAEYAYRELQSNAELISGMSIKLENGHITGGDKKVKGPIASMACTTLGEIYEDNMSRVFLLAVDESIEQTQRVIHYQNELACGNINKHQEEQNKRFIQNLVRMLHRYEVNNPYSHNLHLPPETQKLRRLNELFQHTIKMCTLINQYQRKKDVHGRLITEKEDIETAINIMFDSIVLKVDELDGSLRQFFEKLKTYVKKRGEKYEFTRFEVREATGVSKTQQHDYINKLIALEYLQQYGFANKGYKYKIVYWDNYKALRERIKQYMLQQLEQLNEDNRTPAERHILV